MVTILGVDFLGEFVGGALSLEKQGRKIRGKFGAEIR